MLSILSLLSHYVIAVAIIHKCEACLGDFLTTWVAYRSYDMGVTLVVQRHERHTWGLMTWVVHLRSYDMLCHDTTLFFRLNMSWYRFVVTQQWFSDFIHVMDTGLAVTQQCFPNFNRVMIQVCHDATMFFRFIHVMDTGLVVTQQCLSDFNRVMIQALLWRNIVFQDMVHR